MNINKVILAGRVGTVEPKEFGTGRKIIQMSLATTDGYKKGDKWENKTEWHRLIFAIPGLVERASSVKVGDVIYVEGSINTNEWTDKEGRKNQMKEISCTSYKTIAKAAGKTEERQYNQPKTTVSESMAPKSMDDDDIPF